MKKVSFILPIYNESGNIDKLWTELKNLRAEVTKKFKFDSEFIFVNDASKDDSLEKLHTIYAANKDFVKVLSFSRNYGHQIAVTAGQDIAAGDAIIIMDSDLQDPPMVSLELIAKWLEGYDVVYAQRRRYKTNFIKQTTAFVYYRLMAKIASIDIPVDTGDFRLISKTVNDEMKKYREHARYLRGISSLVGFRQTAVKFDRSDRFAGKPGYTFQKSLKLAFDGITGFSLVPLRLITTFGALFSGLSFLFGFGYILYSIYNGHSSAGWASLLAAIIFLGGVQMLMLGIIGEYIGRIYIESLNRPLYTIAVKYEK
jgi:polyisoprenyl-phosphate glycosyltransferase